MSERQRIWRLVFRDARTGCRVTQFWPSYEAAEAARAANVTAGNEILSLAELDMPETSSAAGRKP